MDFEFKIKEGHSLISNPDEIKHKSFDLAFVSGESVLLAFTDGTFCFQNPDWYTEKYATKLENDWQTRQALLAVGLIDSTEWEWSARHEAERRAKEEIQKIKDKYPHIF